MLNYIWIAFFLIAFVIALVRLVFFHDTEVFSKIVESIFSSSTTGFELAIGYAGLITFWMGLMNVGEKAGIVNVLSKVVGPFFSRLFPGVPKEHPANGQIMMNFSANMLGLDNAATPLGLKAMQSLQELNPLKDTASNAQIMFLVLNTSGLTLIPTTIMLARAQLHAANPTDVFIPILIATFCSTFIGLITVAIWQRINLFDPVFLSWIIGAIVVIAGIVWYFSTLDAEQIQVRSKLISAVVIFSLIVSFIAGALFNKVNVYESFIEGAKAGFETSVKIIPYLVGMLTGIAVFRASGAMDVLIGGMGWMFEMLGFNTDFVPALPTALMKPLSGSGAKAVAIDTMKTLGVDNFASRLSCIFLGAADTTFYIVALYFGSVGVRKTRYAITGGLIADLAGVIGGILVAYLFFGS